MNFQEAVDFFRSNGNIKGFAEEDPVPPAPTQANLRDMGMVAKHRGFATGIINEALERICEFYNVNLVRIDDCAWEQVKHPGPPTVGSPSTSEALGPGKEE